MKFSFGKKGKGGRKTARQIAAAKRNIKLAQQKRDRDVISVAELGFFKRRKANAITRATQNAAARFGVDSALSRGFNKADIYKPGSKASKYALRQTNKANFVVKGYSKKNKKFLLAHYSAKKFTNKNSILV